LEISGILLLVGAAVAAATIHRSAGDTYEI
jgi:hypothetical protein